MNEFVYNKLLDLDLEALQETQKKKEIKKDSSVYKTHPRFTLIFFYLQENII